MARVRLLLLVLAATAAGACALDAGADADAVTADRPGALLSATVGDDVADAIRRTSCGSLCAAVEELRIAWSEGVAAIDASETLAELEAEWPVCMARNGFAVERPSDLDALVMNRLEPALSEGRRPSEEQQASADRLQIRLDNLDAECSRPRERRRSELLIEFEASFVDRFATELDQIAHQGG